jgi:hypothetical protein
MLNEAQFAGTGGWVLKPQGYRDASPVPKQPNGEVSKLGKIVYKTLGLKVEVLAAQDLPLPKDGTKPRKLHP